MDLLICPASQPERGEPWPRNILRLTAEEREERMALISKGKTSAAKIRQAQVVLKADGCI